MADAARLALPFAAFAAFLTIFRLRARREGQTTREWLDERNRRTFAHRGPRAFRAVVLVLWAIVAAGVVVAALVR